LGAGGRWGKKSQCFNTLKDSAVNTFSDRGETQRETESGKGGREDHHIRRGEH